MNSVLIYSHVVFDYSIRLEEHRQYANPLPHYQYWFSIRFARSTLRIQIMPEIYSPPCKLHKSTLFLTKCIGDAIHLGNATTLYVRRMSTDFHWDSDIGKCMARHNNWTRKIINLARLPFCIILYIQICVYHLHWW